MLRVHGCCLCSLLESVSSGVPGFSGTILLLQVQAIMKRLKFNHTNYGFCKNLTEHMLAGYHKKPFPVCISRPVSVGCIAKGPCPGYVGNTSGATGIILSVACGKLNDLC